MYDLHKLGWSSYQQLCHTVLREVLGQTVQSFLDSNDGGRDGAFTGIWTRTGHETLEGQFVFQCKFTALADKKITISDLSDELSKAKRLVESGRCDSYILLTNAGVSGQSEIKIENAFKNVGVKNVAIYGNTWLINQINESKRLRMLVPRIYGIGDLSQILDERAYGQAKDLLESLRDDLAKVVVTSTYQKAVEAMNEHGFVLLIGEAASGKTTIASLLAMAALDQWKSMTFKVDNAEKVKEHWNTLDNSRFFWIDDAFGVTQYESNLVHNWNHVMVDIRTMLSKGNKIVMTSRDYIYKRARRDLKEGAFPLFQESQVVIDVHQLSLKEKSQILYNHLKLGKQSLNFKSEIKPFLQMVAENKKFIPETARRLGDPAFTKSLSLDFYSIKSFVEKQEQFLQDIIQGLDDDCKAALALIYMRNGELESPIELTLAEVNSINRLRSNIGGCTIALDAMNNSLVYNSFYEGKLIWRFKHPTIGDSYSNILIDNPELLEIYLRGSSIERLIDQITAGSVGIEKAVIIPDNLFTILLERLKEFSSTSNHRSKFLASWDAKNRLRRFLSRRCSKNFLEIYILKNPSILKECATPPPYLNYSSEIDLACSLFELGLFPEEFRKELVRNVTEHTLNFESLLVLEDEDFNKMFTNQEVSDLKLKIKQELIPKIAEARRERESNYDKDGSPEQHLGDFLGMLDTLIDEFKDDEDIVTLIKREVAIAKEWIDENEEEHVSLRQKLEDISSQDESESDRSIFEDIEL